MSEFQEQENWSVSDIHYRATREQSNQIAIQMSGTPQVRRRRIINWMLSCIVVRDPSPGPAMQAIEKLATELVDLDIVLELIARDIITRNDGEC